MYEKQTWVSGEIVTEGKLNHMEEGIATGGGIYSVEDVTYFDGEATTTISDLPYADGNVELQKGLPLKDLVVVFNGVKYVLPYIYDAELGESFWGEVDENGPVFDDFPLNLQNGYLYTPEAGTYSLKIMDEEPTFNFPHAFMVKNVNNTLNKTAREIIENAEAGSIICFATDTRIYGYLLALIMPGIESQVFNFYFLTFNNSITTVNFRCADIDDYPESNG